VADEDFTADAWGLSLSGYAAVLQDGVRTRYFVGADARNTPLASFQLRLVVILALSWLVMVMGFAIARYRLDKKRLSRESE
jgi:Na+/melibiose symporter-like transporter